MAYPPQHPQPPPWHGYPQRSSTPGASAGGTDNLALGSMLGQLLAGQERSIFLHEMTVTELRSLPDRIAQRLPPPQTPTPAPSTPTIESRLIIVREIAKTLIPILVLAAFIMGKLTFSEALPILRHVLGLG